MAPNPVSSRRSAAVVAAVLVGILAVPFGPAPPASAEERQRISIGDATTTSRKAEFPPIEGRDPYQPASVDQYTYENCLAGNDTGGVGQHYIVHHRITVDRSNQFGHITKFKLLWPFDEVANPNVLLVQLWKPPTPLRSTAELIAQGGNNGFANIEVNDMENSEFILCIGNRKNFNDGYSIQIEVEYLPLPSFDIPKETPRIAGSSHRGNRPSDFGADPFAAPTTAEATAPPEAIATPGPDGPDGSQPLALVAKQAGQLVTGEGWQTAFTILTILIVVAGSVLVTLRIRRDRI